MKKVISSLTLTLILGTFVLSAQANARIDKMLRTQDLFDTLELTEEQQAEFVEIRDAYQEQLLAARKNSSGNNVKMMADLKAIQYEQVEEVRDVLSEEQQAVFDEFLYEKRQLKSKATNSTKSASDVSKQDERVLE